MYRGAFFGRQHPCHVCAMVRHPWHEGRLHMLPRLKKKTTTTGQNILRVVLLIDILGMVKGRCRHSLGLIAGH